MGEIYYLLDGNQNLNLIERILLVKNKKINQVVINERDFNNETIKNSDLLSNIEINIENGDGILDTIFLKDHSYTGKSKEGYILQKSNNNLGKYFKRIYRPIIGSRKRQIRFFSKKKHRINDIKKELINYREFLPFNNKELISSINQLSVLTESLKLIFQTIQPEIINYNVFGHNIRNLLILTCTEVEAQLKGIIVANSIDIKERYTTKDYVKLCDILKLDKYSVNLGYFPLDNQIQPFKNWNSNNPTKSLTWYDNYNAVKHDRQNEFSKATLWSAIESLAGLAILIKAQYGENIPYWKEQIGGFFKFNNIPRWSIEEKYIPPFNGKNWEKDYLEI